MYVLWKIVMWLSLIKMSTQMSLPSKQVPSTKAKTLPTRLEGNQCQCGTHLKKADDPIEMCLQLESTSYALRDCNYLNGTFIFDDDTGRKAGLNKIGICITACQAQNNNCDDKVSSILLSCLKPQSIKESNKRKRNTKKLLRRKSSESMKKDFSLINMDNLIDFGDDDFTDILEIWTRDFIYYGMFLGALWIGLCYANIFYNHRRMNVRHGTRNWFKFRSTAPESNPQREKDIGIAPPDYKMA